MQIEQKQNRIFKPQSNTTLSAEETNQVTTELENVIRAGNLTPSAGTLTQVRDAIQNVVDTAANELQEQIDAITSASDVFDVVGTYAQLQAYDTSTVPVNDIIKVLQDETRNNVMTYYRWNGTSWVFIGAEGPYYTVSETDTKFATKAQLPGIATNNQVGLVKPDGVSVTIQADGTLNLSSNVAASLPLFTSIWADHILNNASYLRADTFSWQSGAVYVSAYQHLVDDYNNATDSTVYTDTIAGITVYYKRADDGHKVCHSNQETNVSAIYTATGVAWYYILDTTNQRFKLPRSQWNFVGLRNSVGNYVAESLPNITGAFATGDGTYAIGAFSNTGTQSGNTTAGGANDQEISFDASNSSAAYQNDAPVQQRATQMYLYFYVGNTVQDKTTIDVGQITDELNGKVDLPTNKTQADVDFVVESYQNGTSWYRVYKSGWCEQGGVSSNVGYEDITLLKTYRDTNGTVIVTPATTVMPTSGAGNPIGGFLNASTIRVSACNSYSPAYWVTFGYLA